MTTGILPTGLLALATAAATILISQATASAQDGDVIKLDRITVTTPLRRESTLAKSTSSVTVIDEKEIEKSAAVDLPSLLKSYAGVSVSANGGIGSTSGASIRGTKPAQTLVLVNGVRTSSATSGTSSLFNIPLESIERIEIAKGAHSAQYGADAIGGIINIITRKGGVCANGNNSCVTVTTGVMHPWGGHASANIRGQSETGIDYAFGGSILGTHGYEFTLPTAFSHEADDDGYLLGSFNFALSKEFDWGRLYTDGLFARSRSQFDNNDPAEPNETDTDTFTGKAGARIDHSDSWRTTLELSAGMDNSKNFRKGTVIDDSYDSLRYGIFAATEKSFETGDATHVVSVGTEAYHEEIDSNSTFTATERDLAAMFGQYSLEYGDFSFDSGLRYDYNEQFGEVTTYNVGASYLVAQGLTLRASYATGFRAPSFNDLYFSQPFGIGNPNLRPEYSRSYEVGLTWQPTDRTSLDVAFYQSHIDDQINWDTSVFPLQPFNLERAKITGMEITVDHNFDDRWGVWASLDMRKPINDNTGLYVPNQDRLKASAEIDFQATEKLNLRAGVFYVASRFANAANTTKMPSYTTVDVAGIYRLDEQSEFKLSVENLFDKEYERVRGYNAMGRTINLSFSRTF